MTEPTPTPSYKTYAGNCHCGAYKFTLRMPEIKELKNCDCSFCAKKGALRVFPGLVPEPALKVERGEEGLVGYQFGGRGIMHKFCGKCGTYIYAKLLAAPEGQNLGVNARCLQNIDFSLPTSTFEGVNLTPHYITTPYTGPEPSAKIENAKLYTGSCHCGAVTFGLKAKGELRGGEEEVQECNCSICTRNGTILTYPHDTQISISGSSNLTSYSFGRKFQEHQFCKICSVSICIKKLNIEYETWAKDAESAGGSASREKYEEWRGEMPVNLRCLDGLDWEGIVVRKGNWKNVGVEYSVE